MYFLGILIDVGGMFASQWEVVRHCIKGLSDVCSDIFSLYLGSYSGDRVPGIPIGLLCDSCGGAVELLWHCCGIALSWLWDCHGISV